MLQIYTYNFVVFSFKLTEKLPLTPLRSARVSNEWAGPRARSSEDNTGRFTCRWQELSCLSHAALMESWNKEPTSKSNSGVLTWNSGILTIRLLSPLITPLKSVCSNISGILIFSIRLLQKVYKIAYYEETAWSQIFFCTK